MPSRYRHYPPADVPDEFAVMKWSLLAAIVFVCWVALFAMLPRPALLWVASAVQHSFDTISVAVRRMGGWEDERVEDARVGAESGRTVAIDPDLSGRARVIDGDTIEVGTVRVRLHGVDAPESKQSCLAGGERWPCGQRAARALAGQIGGRTVACSERDRDRYGRIVAVCRHGGRDVNAWLVGQGWAMAYRRYSRAYVSEEASARAARRGIWRGEFVPPSDWRRGERLSRSRRDRPRTPEVAPGSCRIKGNISYNSGKRIYHMPGDRDYARTKISPERGERWFCSEAEARGAGWRRAGR
ncbi:MAG: thermonuclease family protein [Rhodospirillaceae bacterium]|nr:thermonuclease family protein [Rhodospirillaceae bacterium]